MTIDWHNHWLSPTVISHLERRGAAPKLSRDGNGALVYTGQPSALPSRGLTLAAGFTDIPARIAHLDQLGISRQVISWPTTFGLDPALPAAELRTLFQGYNQDLSALLSRHGDRFSGLAALTTADVDWSARELDRGFRDLGLIGGVLPVGALHSLDGAKALAPIFEVAQRHRGHIYLHTGQAHATIPGQSYPVPAQDAPGARWALDCAHQYAAAILTLTLTDFLAPYPDVSIQLAMLGGAFAFLAEPIQRRVAYDLGADSARPFSRVYVDTGVFGEGRRALALAIKTFGADRVLFGSDYPLVPVSNALTALAEADITEAERRQVLANGRDILDKPALAA